MRLDQMPWPRAGAAGAVKEAIWNARALACNVTRSLECQTRANFFSDTFAVRATDGCTMPCYVYTFIHQFSLSIFDRATTLVIFIILRTINIIAWRVSFFFRKLIYETRNIFFSYLAKYRSVRDKFIRSEPTSRGNVTNLFTWNVINAKRLNLT